MLRSLVLVLLLSALRVSAADFQFDDRGVTASPVTPGATTYWMCGCIDRFAGSLLFAQYAAIVPDSDGDGVVRWEMGDEMTEGGLWLMIDGTTGSMVARPRLAPAVSVSPSPFPAKPFLRDQNGASSRLVMHVGQTIPYTRLYFLFWIRPGVGMWTGQIADGGLYDEAPDDGNLLVYDVHGMHPLDGSSSTTGGLQPGDFFAVMDYQTGFWTASRVDAPLGEASGGGAISFARITGSEDDGKMTITLVRTEGTDGAVSVRYATADDTARAGVHYQATSGTATFEPGQIFTSFDVPVIDDKIDAASARFRVLLSEPSGATIATASRNVAIDDNDDTPIVRIEVKIVPEGDGEPREIPMKVYLDHTAPQPVTLEWASSDFFTREPLESGTVQFAVGEKEKTILVHYTPDDAYGGTFGRIRITMDNVVNALAAGEGLLTILEDDPRPVTTIESVTVSEKAREAKLTVRLSAPLLYPYTLHYQTQDGTATTSQDYAAASGSVVLPAGQLSATITIPLQDDPVLEGPETFRVVISESFDGELVGTVTILDDEQPARRRSMRH